MEAWILHSFSLLLPLQDVQISTAPAHGSGTCLVSKEAWHGLGEHHHKQRLELLALAAHGTGVGAAAWGLES